MVWFDANKSGQVGGVDFWHIFTDVLYG